MIARIAAAATITHLAHVAGHQKTAITTTAAANKNRQKQSFMIIPPSSTRSNYYRDKHDFIATSIPAILRAARAAVENAAWRLYPPVSPSMSRTSPMKKRRGEEG